MTTKGGRHYRHIAQVLNDARGNGGHPGTVDHIATELAAIFKHDNSSFSYAKWYAGVGITIPQCHQETNHQ